MISSRLVPVHLWSREGTGHTHAEVVFGTAIVGQKGHRVVWRDVLWVLAYEIYEEDM